MLPVQTPSSKVSCTQHDVASLTQFFLRIKKTGEPKFPYFDSFKEVCNADDCSFTSNMNLECSVYYHSSFFITKLNFSGQTSFHLFMYKAIPHGAVV